jgi:NADH dehydrogenase
MLDAVTGAFSFTGRAIAGRLLSEGRDVVTLVRRHGAPDADGRIQTAIVTLDDAVRLIDALQGVDTLYNTHWIRFARGNVNFELAIQRTRRLLDAARRAGVRRVVHVSVVNASETAPTAYFRAKAQLEADVRSSGLSYAIVRPTLTFGSRDILVNNLCWVLRRFPVFVMPGDGRYRLQPVHVDDVARIAIEAGQASADLVTDAAGPDILTFNQFVRLLADTVRSRAWLVHAPSPLSLAGSRVLGLLVRDVMLTRDEVTELTASLLVSGEPPQGTIHLSDWASAHADELGRTYHSELDRHYR